MKITTKRHTVHKTLHKEDNDIRADRPVLSIMEDMTSLIPLKHKGYKGKSRDIHFLEGDIIGVRETEIINRHNLFNGDEVFEDQLYISIIAGELAFDLQFRNVFMSKDWQNNIVERNKRDLLVELGERISNTLGIDIDFVDYYSESLKEYLGVKEVFSNPSKIREVGGFNINLAMFFKLMVENVVSISVDTVYTNGESILLQPYTSISESYNYICRNSDSKPFCVVQAFRDRMYEVERENYIVKALTKDVLEELPESFYYNRGFNSVFELLADKLK